MTYPDKPIETIDHPDHDEHPSLKSTRKLSWLMDNCIRLPGGFRVGLDGIVGLIPGVGDVVGAAFTMGIFASALHHKAPLSTLLKIAFYLVIDLTIGAIPFIGDLFDFFFKSNARSLAALEDHLRKQWKTEKDKQNNI